MLTICPLHRSVTKTVITSSVRIDEIKLQSFQGRPQDLFETSGLDGRLHQGCMWRVLFITLASYLIQILDFRTICAERKFKIPYLLYDRATQFHIFLASNSQMKQCKGVKGVKIIIWTTRSPYNQLTSSLFCPRYSYIPTQKTCFCLNQLRDRSNLHMQQYLTLKKKLIISSEVHSYYTFAILRYFGLQD